jgi:hypothetical protein
MEASRRLVDLFVTRPVSSQGKASIYPGVVQRADQVCRAILSGLATARDVAEPVRVRLKAPLIRPPRFGTVKEYRTWKSHRSARPPKWNALQWPLGVWLGLGTVLALWVKSLLS